MQILLTCRAAETTVDRRRAVLGGAWEHPRSHRIESACNLEGLSEDELEFFVPGERYRVSFERLPSPVSTPSLDYDDDNSPDPADD